MGSIDPNAAQNNVWDMSTQGGFTNPVKASDYQAVDLTGSSAFQGYQAAQNANQTNYANAANMSAMQQALSNVQGIGGEYGALGAGNSGAAYAAMQQGAAQPYFQAQQDIANQANQNTNHLYDAFTGVAAPQYTQNPSQLENYVTQLSAQKAQNQS